MLRVSTIHGCVPDRRKIYIKGTVALFLSILLEFDNSYLLCPTMPIFAHQKVSQRRRRRTPLSLSVKNCVKRRIGSTVFPSTRHRDERIFLGCVLLMCAHHHLALVYSAPKRRSTLSSSTRQTPRRRARHSSGAPFGSQLFVA
jgi:hypothetical protein